MHFSRFFLLLAALAAAVLSPASAWATLNGQGTADAPYQISSAAELAEFGQLVVASELVGDSVTYPNQKAYAVLTADIDLSTISGNWTPIGTADVPFMGSFDGQGHSITGLSILGYTTGCQGLFGRVAGTHPGGHAQLKNFSVSGTMTSSTSGLAYIGGVVGNCDYVADLTDITSNVNITLDPGTVQSHVGGVAGRSSRTNMERCVNNGNIDAGASWECIGGLQAYTTGYSAMKHCLNTGNLTTTADNAYIGGMLGYQNNNKFSGCHNCLNTGTITAGTLNTNAGAIYGCYRTTTAVNSKGSNNYYLASSAGKAVGSQVCVVDSVTGECNFADDLTDVCTAITADRLSNGDMCAVLGYHYFSGADRSECSFCHHGFLRYTATSDTLPVTPYNTDQLLDADGNALTIISNAYVAAEGQYVMEFGKPLAAIGVDAFKQCTTLTSVTLPTSLTAISDGAFQSCSGLTALHIPANVTSIHSGALHSCSALEAITVDAENTVYDSRDNCNAIIRTADNMLLLGCKNTVIPSAVAAIGDNAFRGCNGLTGTLTLPTGLTSIGSDAFNGCSGLSGTLTLPEGITTVSTGAFQGCSGLSGTLAFPEALTNIGDYAFYGCSGLSRLTFFPALARIGALAFEQCGGISLVEFKSIPQLGFNSFGFSINLPGMTSSKSYTLSLSDGSYVSTSSTSASFPSLASAPTFARATASEWGTLVLPFALTYSRSNGNYRLYTLDSVSGTGLTLAEYEEGADIAAGTPMIIRAVGSRNAEGNYELLLTAAGNTISKGVSAGSATCAADAFTMKSTFAAAEVTAADSVDLYVFTGALARTAAPASVAPFSAWFETAASADAPAFYTLPGAYFLRYTTSDSLPVTPFMPSQLLDADGNAVEILANAYVEAESECVMVLSQPLAAIGFQVFYGCTTLTGIDLPSALTGIGNYAFRGCTGLSGIDLPSALTGIGNSAFSGCTGLSGTLTLPAGLTAIEKNAFYGCTGLSGIDLPAGLTTIKDNSFYGCSGLTGTLTLPAGVDSIGSSAFYGCSGLTGTLTIPAGVDSIGTSAFRGCTGLSGLSLPDSLSYIGAYAFLGCTGLSGTLTIPAGITTVNNAAFQGCTGLSGTLTLHAGVVRIGSHAFSSCTGLDSVVLNSIPLLGVTGISAFNNVTAAITLSLSDRSYVYTGTGTYNQTLAAEPTFVRTMANEWGTIVVPLALNYSRTNGSYRLYRLSSTTASEMIFAEYEDGETIAAGTPMVIRAVGSRNAEGNFEITLTAADRTYPKGVKPREVSNSSSAGAAARRVLAEEAASPAFTTKGSFAARSVTPADSVNLYYLSSGSFLKADAPVSLDAFSAWFETAASSELPDVYGIPENAIWPTALEDTDANAAADGSSSDSSAARKLLLDGRVVILRAGHFYDPSGRLLQ